MNGGLPAAPPLQQMFFSASQPCLAAVLKNINCNGGQTTKKAPNFESKQKPGLSLKKQTTISNNKMAVNKKQDYLTNV